ncbi:MAG TPA: tyrosine-type recombinase/integrase [Anaerolineales bacterium]|nr:tyrosine-type recombinase/integrase [Anaerolineales bacterium]
MPADMTVQGAVENYLDTVRLARAENTFITYKKALAKFTDTLQDRRMPPDKTPITDLKEDAIAWFIQDLKNYAPATEALYLKAAFRFYRHLVAEDLMPVNLPRLKMILDQRGRKQGTRLPQFPRDEIEQVLNYAQELNAIQTEGEQDRLILLRDRAFLITLADTGLRVHEACGLRRGDVSWNEGRAILIGKGDKEAVIRFSTRSLQALKDYLNARAAQDGASGRPLPSLPVFSRHDKGAGGKTKPITTTTGRNIVNKRVGEVLGDEAAGRITPHSFRHFFVTTVLIGSGGNLKLAQELARHENIDNTQRYAHLYDDELDRGYHEIFENR